MINNIKRILKNFFQHKKTKMEQEIFEQPDVIFELIRKYINNHAISSPPPKPSPLEGEGREGGWFHNKSYFINITVPDGVKKLALIASGSSYNSASIISNFIQNNSNFDVHTYYSSELAINENFKTDNETLYIFISQSGETSDTNIAFDKIKENTNKTFVITNVKNSKLWNNSEYKMLTLAGTEKAVASTKSMSAQLFCLFLLSLKLMEINNISIKQYIDELINVPEYIKNIFPKQEEIKAYANILSNYEHAVILASDTMYQASKEGALKIKETTYINAQAYPTGEFLHGHIALLNQKCLVILIVNELNLHSAIDVLIKINNNYKTNTLIISSLNIKDVDKKDFIQTDTKSDISFLFSTLVILQLLTLETAAILNRNIDKPEGLSKVIK